MGQLLDGSWVTKCDPLSALHRVANETSLNQMADSVDDEQYAKFANSVTGAVLALARCGAKVTIPAGGARGHNMQLN